MNKTFEKFREIELSAIEPEGWLRGYLEIQKQGLTGHLEVAGAPFDGCGWGGPYQESSSERGGGIAFWPYEQNAYWMDGVIRCGVLLNDSFLMEKAKKQLDYVLIHSDSDGYLGPQCLKTPSRTNRWPHAVFFRAMTAYYRATGDPKIPAAIEKHYLSETSPHNTTREVCNVESMVWAYFETGNVKLLELASKAYDEFNELTQDEEKKYDPVPDLDDCSVVDFWGRLEFLLSDRKPEEHGVTFNERAKLPAILYMATGEKKYLQASVNAYRKIDRDSMLVSGVCSSSEFLRGKDPLDSHEICDIVDYSWSMGYLLMATGEVEYADKIERATFNAAPGSVTRDFKALQYYSSPNQVICDSSSNHNLSRRGQHWMAYRPNHGIQCCMSNVNRNMPNYISRMWMQNSEQELTAVLYGPGRITTQVGASKQEVTLIEKTSYPFDEQIDFQVRTETPVDFTLVLRIPGWCAGAELTVNGEPVQQDLKAGTFVKLKRVFENNDRIRLVLPMELKLTHWPRGGIAVERGPLVYSLKIEEDWQVHDTTNNCSAEFPSWHLYPQSDWNYALCLDEENLKESVKIIRNRASNDPWNLENAPIELRVPARKVKGWEILHTSVVETQDRADMDMVVSKMRGDGKGDGVINAGDLGIFEMEGDFKLTPPLPDPDVLKELLEDEVETVVLVPYGCTRLRLTVLPQVK